jgi:DNA polymerase I-like protein with 3'-5' exonuclease and polymerase domains
MNYIITNNRDFFESIGQYNYCRLEDMVLPSLIAVDTETTSLKPRKGHMFALQIGTGVNNYLIDMQQLGGEITFKEVQPYLEGKDMVGHNLTFDLGWFYKYDYWPTKVWDTMLASMLLHNGDKSKRHSFGAVMERELGIIYDKTEQKNIHKIQLNSAAAIQYCFNDVDRLVELMKVLADKMRDYGVTEAFKLHCQYVRALAYMEQCGLPINVEKWKKKITKDKEEFLSCEKAVVSYIYEHLPNYRGTQGDLFSTDYKITLNLNSPLQMIPVFKKLGINVEDDKDSSKETITESVISRSPHPFVKLWLNYTGAQKVISTYGENVLEKVEDGKIYSSYNPMLDTARISTRKGEFPSLVIPSNEWTRECFEAPEGYRMIVIDYMNQEGVVGADMHNDPVTVASVTEGKDLHCALARVIFEELTYMTDEEITKNHKDKRQFAKAPRFAKAYGGNGFTIAKNLGVSLKEGERISNAYDMLHTGIIAWGEGVFKKAVEVGYIESADGFKLKLPFFEQFQELHEWIQDKDREFWTNYGKGKAIFKANKLKLDLKELIEKHGKDSDEAFKFKEEYFEKMLVEDDDFAYSVYLDNKGSVGDYFRQKSKYMRLCLNNPIQTTSAFQTKRAVVMLFEEIVKNGDQWKVCIGVVPHDEQLLYVIDSLVNKYKEIVEYCMREAGNYYLTSGLVKMGADANIGSNWYEAK